LKTSFFLSFYPFMKKIYPSEHKHNAIFKVSVDQQTKLKGFHFNVNSVANADIRKIIFAVAYVCINKIIFSLFSWSKQKWLFWKAGFFSSQSEQFKNRVFFPANQSSLKNIKKAPIGWKAAFPKMPLLFWSYKQANFWSEQHQLWHSIKKRIFEK